MPKKARYENSKHYDKYIDTFNGWSARILARIKHRAKAKGIEYNLDLNWYRNKLKTMKCEVTGLNFADNFWGKGKISPYTPTIDKKDPSLGYTKENCQIVVWIYNAAKQNFTHNDVVNLAQSLKNEF